jgi:hypothetical protein
MKESVAVAKEADAKKGVSPTRSDKSIHRVRDEPERQLGSLRDVINTIRHDGGTPSVDSIATELSGIASAERASVLLALQQTHGNRYVQRVVVGIQAKQTSMQRNVQRSCSDDPEQIKRAAVEGVSGSGGKLPYLEKIQTSFGAHDVTDVQAHVGGAAGKASDAIGAKAYTMGDHVAFKEVPDLHTAAHEAAHAVQQRSGVQLQKGVGQIGDVYERHADEVADRVVQRRSAEDLLSRATGTALRQVVQMSYDEFMCLPRPRENLFREIEDLSLTDVNNILRRIGTPQHPDNLWQRIEGRYTGGTAQLVYDRLIERRNRLQSEGQGEEVERTEPEVTTTEGPTEREVEGAEHEPEREATPEGSIVITVTFQGRRIDTTEEALRDFILQQIRIADVRIYGLNYGYEEQQFREDRDLDIRVVRAVVDLPATVAGGRTMPSPELMRRPRECLTAAQAAFGSHNYQEALRHLGRAAARYNECISRWYGYLGRTISSAETWASGLQTFSDISIAVGTTVLTGGMGAGTAALITGGIALQRALAVEGAEWIVGVDPEVDVAGVLRETLTAAATQFVGSSISGRLAPMFRSRLSGALTRLFGRGGATAARFPAATIVLYGEGAASGGAAVTATSIDVIQRFIPRIPGAILNTAATNTYDHFREIRITPTEESFMDIFVDNLVNSLGPDFIADVIVSSAT